MADDLNALLSSRAGQLPAPVVLNPLAAMSSAAQTAGNIYSLREKQAQEAAGQAYQGAINQDTGEFDANRFRTLLAQSGPAAMAAGAALLNTQQISSNQLEQNLKKAQWVNSAAGAAAISGDYSDAAMLKLFQTGIANGVLTMPEVQKQIQILPQDAAGRKRWLEEHRDTAASVETQLQQQYGTPGTVTGPGGAKTGYTQAPARAGSGITTLSQQGAPQGLDPGQAAARTQWLQSPRDYPDPANPTVTKHGTNETYLKDTGVPDAVIYTGGAPATLGTQPATPSPLGTGRPPATLLNPNKPQATPITPAPTSTPTTPAPAPAPVSGGGYTIGGSPNPLVSPAPATSAPVTPAPAPSTAGTGISGPTPAQVAAAKATEATGTLGPPRFQQEVDAGTQAQNQQALLGNMLADTSQFTTGPLAGIVGKVRNLAGNLGLNINTEAQSAKESFNKLAAGLANAQGAGSDARMNVNISANPHEELSPAGVDMILRQLQGNADYVRARASLAGKYPHKEDYSGFQESIKDLDPRVFQMSRMTDDQRGTYWKSLDSEAKKQIDAAGKKARELGVLGG